MKVISKQTTSTTNFRDVGDGQVFIYNDDDDAIFMKLDHDYFTHDEHGYEAETFNAVHLESGELCEFRAYDQVRVPHRVTPMEVMW